ncbi:unnamed protein product [Thelazia callipaeda]|uniref:SRCR domain-containing protein n=1 Tax=Thelazia callipaeda TaxID=103827 RepID=A0A0N5DBX5_THECL|nr:unnamed protein product [Thelazia callipaeda]
MSCGGKFVVEKTENETYLANDCNWDKDRDLVLSVNCIDERCSGIYTCQEGVGKPFFTSFQINVSTIHQARRTRDNDGNKLLLKNKKCSSMKQNDQKLDQHWTRSNGEMICSKRSLIEICESANEEERQENGIRESQNVNLQLFQYFDTIILKCCPDLSNNIKKSQDVQLAISTTNP